MGLKPIVGGPYTIYPPKPFLSPPPSSTRPDHHHLNLRCRCCAELADSKKDPIFAPMVSKRQRLARRHHKEENPELYPKAEEPARKLKGGRVGKRKGSRGSRLKPGDSCFICKGKDHIAKLCPRKAEWEKNKICLFCRRRGHSLKNCPSKEEGTDKKYCYNCGESGHSLSTCPQPLQDGGTKFATCFICNESGHLSKNCPKSTHGIYPKGGSCKNCGSVRHLAKDCPDKSKKKSDVGVDKSFEFSNYSWQGKKASFTSGDDLEDDFTEDKKINRKEEAMNSKETVKNTCPANKKRGPKVVNFVG